MPLFLTATLTITCETKSAHAAQKEQKVPSPVAYFKPHPHLLDLKQCELSANILSMQRHIREGKRQEHDARAAGESAKAPKGHASALDTNGKMETTEEDGRSTGKDNWKTLDLEDVQPWDLEQMDLTGLSPSLLAHPTDSEVDDTESEREMMTPIENKASRQKDT
jgi:hypothetical protein